jgi:hypothetical protein
MTACSFILLQTFEYCLIIRSGILVCVGIDDEGNLRVQLSEPVEEVLEFSINDDEIYFGVVKDICDIVLFQTVVDRWS